MSDRWPAVAADLHLARHAASRPSTVPKVATTRREGKPAVQSAPVLPFEVLSTNPLTIRIPVKLPSLANARGSHWSGKASLAARVRRIVKSALMVPAKPALPVRVTMVRVSPGTLDDNGNLQHSTKAVQDQIADWLGLPSDRDPRGKFVTEQRKAKGYACEVTFEPMTDALAVVKAARGGG